ncbi:hypothetical protein LINPERHAP2_LOCUS17287, partial [Linum perenne]
MVIIQLIHCRTLLRLTWVTKPTKIAPRTATFRQSGEEATNDSAIVKTSNAIKASLNFVNRSLLSRRRR